MGGTWWQWLIFAVVTLATAIMLLVVVVHLMECEHPTRTEEPMR